MTEEMRLRLKITSLLLQFPDERSITCLDSIEEMVKVLPSEKPRKIFENTISDMKRASLLELQEDYTRVFDLDPATSLNLTYHRWGNEKDRGRALASISSIFRKAGYEASNGDLPDFLPAVLELLALAPEDACAEMLEKVGGEILVLASRLGKTAGRYGSLLEALEGIVQNASIFGE